MSIQSHAQSVMKRMMLTAGIGMAAGAAATIASGFLLAAFFVWLTEHFGVPAAAALMAAFLLICAAMISAIGAMIVKRMKRRESSLWAEIASTATIAKSVGALITMVIRKDPKKALVLAAVAGVVAEYLTTDRRKK